MASLEGAAEHAALKKAIDTGEIGSLDQLTVTSRDPAPPPLDYIPKSGGLFRDMMIHDFDMARWILGEEPVSIYSRGSCLVDPKIGKLDDIETACVTMVTASGRQAIILNSRRAGASLRLGRPIERKSNCEVTWHE